MSLVVSKIDVPPGNWGTFQNKVHGLYLTVIDKRNTVGALVNLRGQSNDNDQKWCFEDCYFKSGIRTEDGHDLFLEITNDSSAPGATLQLNTKTGAKGQRWNLGSNGLVSWVNGYVLDIRDCNSFDGAYVCMQTINGNNTQAWIHSPSPLPRFPNVGK